MGAARLVDYSIVTRVGTRLCEIAHLESQWEISILIIPCYNWVLSRVELSAIVSL